MRPPAEFLGLARALRWRVAAVDTQVDLVVKKVVSRLQERVRRHPRRPVREGALIDLERFWRASMPTYAQIGSCISIADRWEPTFTTMRCSAVRFSTDLWGGQGADGLTISLVTVRVRQGRVTADPTILGACSLHSLARRIERGADRSDEAVFEDLARLGWRYEQLMIEGADKFVLPVSDGSWAGSLVWCDGKPSALAQTWLVSDLHATTVLPPVGTLEDLVKSLANLPAMERVE